MKDFWLFQPASARLTGGKKMGFWLWNGGVPLLAGLCLGVLSLAFAYGDYTDELFLSYFQTPLIAVLNIVPAVLVLALLYCLIGRAWIAFLSGSLLVMGPSIANYYKLRFRDDPLMFADLQYIREAGSITKKAHYDLTPDKRIFFAVLCVLAGTVLLALLVRGVPRARVRLPLFLAAVLICVPLSKVYTDSGLYNVKTENFGPVNRWSATQVYFSKGFLYPFLYSTTQGSLKEPTGYDPRAAEALLASYASADIPEEERVDVVTIQLEAFADLSRFADVEGVDWDAAYGAYHALEAESYTGDLVTNVFAAGTIDTERCFLTGLADLWNFRGDVNSYGWYFGDQGYVTEGSHPSLQWFYNRVNVNPYLGLSNYYFLENYYEEINGGGIAPDAVLLPEIFRLYAANRDGEGAPYFSFNVTYQGHGPYETEKNSWPGRYTDGRYSPETTHIVDNYLGSAADTADQLASLIDQFRAEDRPVVVVVYGDHKPWLGNGNSAYQELGVNLDTGTEEGFYNYYTTRYLIWGNDAAKAALDQNFAGAGPDVSSCYLMNELFDLCGWKGSEWMQAFNDVRAVIPVLTTVGRFVQADGVLTDELSSEGRAALETYKGLEYYSSKHFQG